VYVAAQLPPASVQVSPPHVVQIPDRGSAKFDAVAQGAAGNALKLHQAFVWSSDNVIATIAPTGKTGTTATVTLNTGNPGAGVCSEIAATVGTRRGTSRTAITGVGGCFKLTVSPTGNGYGA